ncbi:MAG: hypothetical protein PUG13_03840 [Streptococcus hyointestinalis]|nr:hypothetical protein [Streptococcus hyointestinalis]MDD6384528.1 hypothetical protein [Streptococcus hyointestinalis]
MNEKIYQIFKGIIDNVLLEDIKTNPELYLDKKIVELGVDSFIYKSGDETSLNCKDFSDKRKNESKKRTGDSEELYSNDTNNDEKLYPQATDTTDRVCRKIKAMLTKKLF